MDRDATQVMHVKNMSHDAKKLECALIKLQNWLLQGQIIHRQDWVSALGAPANRGVPND